MQFIIYFDICAIAIITMELFMFYMKKNIPNIGNKVFVLMMWLVLGSAICDLLGGIYKNEIFPISRDEAEVVIYGYYIFHTAIPFLFVLYNLCITERIHRIFKQASGYFLAFPVIFAYILIALNPYLHCIFELLEDGSLKVHTGLMYVYVQSAFYYVTAIIYIQLYNEMFKFYKRMSLYIFVMLTFIPLTIQSFHPNWLLEVFGMTLGMVVLYLGIQGTEEILDKQLGVFNKSAFIEKTRMNFKSKNEFSVISISVDEWDFLQKTFGIDALDLFLIQFIKEIKRVTEDLNVELYHISENEFYILIFGPRQNIDELAKVVLGKCEKTWKCGEVEIPVTVDVCVIRCPEDFDNVDDIIQCTDYIAKEEHGYGSRVIYAKDISSGYGKRRSAIRHAIHKAIRNHSLQVYYQPIYSTKEERILSAEALVRLIDDELGNIPPDEFIPIAEADGSIVRIGNFVLESVCNFMMENKLEEKGIQFIEINVSVVECMKQDMVDRVEKIVRKYKLSPHQVNLEMTETAASNSADILSSNMKNLVERGIAFSLDDYGSGYSNISYIINLPFHLVKMDKNIVWSAFDNEKAGTVLESSVSMIQKLNLKIVAEGVETKEQKDALTAMGCEYLQGFYFSKPLPEKEFLKYLEEHTGKID